MKYPVLFAGVLVALAACDSASETVPQALPPVPAPQSAPPVPPLVATGPVATVQASADRDDQTAASVVRLDVLTKQGGPTVKLFGTGGGDPAMNGLYTHIAFFGSPAEGWAVFRLGDFLDYEILSETPGRVDLKVEESVLDPATGQIGRRHRRLIVAWTSGTNEAPPATIMITPAR